MDRKHEIKIRLSKEELDSLNLKVEKTNLSREEFCRLCFKEVAIKAKPGDDTHRLIYEIRKIGAEFGVTTGRPRRCGWFDAIVAKYAALVSSLTGVALTKLDVFDNFDKIKVCTAYKDKRNGKIYNFYPTNVYIHKYLEPVYEEIDGWKQDITKVKSYDELPENAKKYLKRLEELIGVPITIISVGPDRDQTIILQNPFE